MSGQRIRPEDVEIARRSVVLTGTLPTPELERLLDDYARLLRERAEIERLLHHAMPSWRNLRHTLNKLAHVLGEGGGPD